MTSRRLALALIATAQFVLVLDITIVTIALPTIQRELGSRPGISEDPPARMTWAMRFSRR